MKANRDKEQAGGMDTERPEAVFRINAVQLVVGVIFMGAGVALLAADIGATLVGVLSLIYGLMGVVAFAKGRIRIYGDRVEVAIPGVSKAEIPLSGVAEVKRCGSSIRIHVEGRKKPVVLPWWIVRPDDVEPIHALIEERWSSHAAAGQEA